MATQKANCFLRPDGNTVGSGPITWTIENTSILASEFFTGIGTSGNNLVLSFPSVSKVKSISFGVSPGLAKAGCFVGASVALSSATIQLWQNIGCPAGHLVGAGSSWTRNGDLTGFTFGVNNANTVTFQPPVPYAGTIAQNQIAYLANCIASYVGSNDRRLKKKTSGLGADVFGYELYDSAGVLVATNDANDIIEIMLPKTPKPFPINCGSNNSSGHPGATVLLATEYISVRAEFEV